MSQILVVYPISEDLYHQSIPNFNRIGQGKKAEVIMIQQIFPPMF